MITLRRAEERHHNRRRRHEFWFTFDPQQRADALADGFGALELLSEDRVAPGADLPRHTPHDAEIVTYVHQGALAYEDAMDGAGVICAGEFRRMSGPATGHGATNASLTDWAHVFRAWMRPSQVGLEHAHEQKRFSAAERRGLLCVIASPDARSGSLRIHQDALMYSALLHRGHHLVHELSQGRSSWLHLVEGEVSLRDFVLTTGDGAGITAERAVSLTAREETELLLFDLGEHPPRSP